MNLFDFLNSGIVKLSDVLDILIIWFLLYNLLRFLQGSRAMQIALGISALFVANILAQQLQLIVLSNIIGSLFSIIPIAIMILFQEEIRRVLASIGRTPFLNRRIGDSAKYEVFFKTALAFSDDRIGAIIVFEGEENLNEFVETGTRLDAQPSYELLKDIFTPRSMLHDGAVIVGHVDRRILAAGCILPLSRDENLPRFMGTRHRAGIGISEHADCLALVVSEETGNIILTHRGQMHPVNPRNMASLNELFNALTEHEKAESSTAGPAFQAKKLARRVRNYRRSRAQAKKREASQ